MLFLSKIDVYEVKIIKKLGIISVNYNEEKISAAMMLEIILNILGLDEEIYKRKRSKIKRAIQDDFDILDITVYNKTKSMLDVKTIFALLFVGYGLKQIINKNPRVKGGRLAKVDGFLREQGIQTKKMFDNIEEMSSEALPEMKEHIEDLIAENVEEVKEKVKK